MQKLTPSKGFTLVELLIVIVVIAILAAISVVSYIGIQDRARTSSGQTLANQIYKKAELFRALHGSYPSPDHLINNNPQYNETRLDDPDMLKRYADADVRQASSFEDGTRVVYGWRSTNGGCVYYWNYTEDTYEHITVGVPSSPCSNIIIAGGW